MLAALTFLNSSRTRLLALLLQQRALSGRGLGVRMEQPQAEAAAPSPSCSMPSLCPGAHLAPALQARHGTCQRGASSPGPKHDE